MVKGSGCGLWFVSLNLMDVLIQVASPCGFAFVPKPYDLWRIHWSSWQTYNRSSDLQIRSERNPATFEHRRVVKKISLSLISGCQLYRGVPRWLATMSQGYEALVWPTPYWDPVADFALCSPSRSPWSCAASGVIKWEGWCCVGQCIGNDAGSRVLFQVWQNICKTSESFII